MSLTLQLLPTRKPARFVRQLRAFRFTLENGQKRYELVNLKVADGEVYRKLQGKPVRVPVGAFASGGGIVFYALKDVPQVAA